MCLEPAFYVIRYTDLLEKPLGATGQVEPRRFARVKPSLSTHRAAPLVSTRSITDFCFPLVSVSRALPRHLLVAAGYNNGGVEVGFSRDLRVSGLQVVKTSKYLSA